MMPPLTVPKPMLMAVLNEASLHGLGTLTVGSPIFGIPLLSIDLVNSQLSVVTSREEMEAILEEMKSNCDHPVIDDLPDFGDLMIAVMNSVCIPRAATQPIVDELKKINANRSEPYRFPRQTCFAIDTNIAYFRLFSRLFLQGEMMDRLGVSPTDIQIIVTNVVEEEISRAIADKYSTDELEALRTVVWDKVLVETMFNICHKKGRKALNAQTEIDVLGRMFNIWKISGFVPSSDNREEIDEDIVSSLSLHAQNQGLDMIFVTADDKCRAHAYAHKLPSVLVKFAPYPRDEIPFDPWSLVELLHDLSINFIGLAIPELGLKIFGDWTGKSAVDFHAQKVKLLIANESPIGAALEQDLAIIQNLGRLIEERDWKKIS